MIVNTHLFFHPLAEHIRVFQVNCILTNVAKIKDQIFGSKNLCISVLIAGDLNVQPQDSGIALLKYTHVSSVVSLFSAVEDSRWMTSAGLMARCSSGPRS